MHMSVRRFVFAWSLFVLRVALNCVLILGLEELLIDRLSKQVDCLVTLERHRKCLPWFSAWIVSNDCDAALASLAVVLDTIDKLIREYGHALDVAGEPYYKYAYTITSLIGLPYACAFSKLWITREPAEHSHGA